MSQREGGDEHVETELGLYVLGASSVAESVEIEEHLARCVSCRVERDQLAEVVAILALLTEDDVTALADEFGGLDSGGKWLRHDRPGR